MTKLIVEKTDGEIYVYEEDENHFEVVEKGARANNHRVSPDILEDECSLCTNELFQDGSYIVFNLADKQDRAIKPKKHVIECWDYHECRDFVFKKLGYNNASVGPTWNKIVIGHNGTFEDGKCIYIGSEIIEEGDNLFEWARPIVKAFIEEFGDHQEYWIS